MIVIYFWKGNKVHEYVGSADTGSIKETNYMRCFAVDTGSKNPATRYGKYLKHGWEHTPIEQFPPKFRTHLLLLGIT